jgi:hypothetical protein
MTARALLVLALLGCNDSAVAPGGSVDKAFRCRTALDVPAACAACLEANCCDEAIACGEDLRCKPCIQPAADGPSCQPPGPPEAWAFINCEKASCSGVCPPPFGGPVMKAACEAPLPPPSLGSCVTIGSPGIGCNPVTNGGCIDGAACDASDGGYACYADGNVGGTCELCGYGNPLDFCVGGHHCAGVCARYCCSDADCGSRGHCDRKLIDDVFEASGYRNPVPDVGLCMETP